MKYGAFGLVEVLGSCNAVMVIDQMLKTADVSFRTWNGKCGGHEVVFMICCYCCCRVCKTESTMRHYSCGSDLQSF